MAFPTHQAISTVAPVVGDALNPGVVVADINALKTSYNAHDSDRGLHVVVGPLITRPSATIGAGSVYVTSDSPHQVFLSDGVGWYSLDYVLSGATIVALDQQLYLHTTRG